MVTPISGLNPLLQVAVMEPKTAQADSSASPKTTVQPKKETVEISKAAKARLLKNKGETVVEIAISLNLDTKTVNSYLESNVATKQTAATSPQVKQTAAAAHDVKHSAPSTSQSSGTAENPAESGVAKMAEVLQGK